MTVGSSMPSAIRLSDSPGWTTLAHAGSWTSGGQRDRRRRRRRRGGRRSGGRWAAVVGAAVVGGGAVLGGRGSGRAVAPRWSAPGPAPWSRRGARRPRGRHLATCRHAWNVGAARWRQRARAPSSAPRDLPLHRDQGSCAPRKGRRHEMRRRPSGGRRRQARGVRDLSTDSARACTGRPARRRCTRPARRRASSA